MRYPQGDVPASYAAIALTSPAVQSQGCLFSGIFANDHASTLSTKNTFRFPMFLFCSPVSITIDTFMLQRHCQFSEGGGCLNFCQRNLVTSCLSPDLSRILRKCIKAWGQLGVHISITHNFQLGCNNHEALIHCVRRALFRDIWHICCYIPPSGKYCGQ